MAIGCAGPQLAEAFVDELSLQHCTVGYIARQSEMPRWGQLGCNGLIVIDAAQQIVCPATTAFMQLRGLAFRHVEALLDALLEGEEKGEEGRVGGVARRAVMPKACPGEMVRLDTENPAMRGRVGVVMDTPGPMGVPLDERRSTVCLLGEGKGGRGGGGGQGGEGASRENTEQSGRQSRKAGKGAAGKAGTPPPGKCACSRRS